jgi:hypothetical protein
VWVVWWRQLRCTAVEWKAPQSPMCLPEGSGADSKGLLAPPVPLSRHRPTQTQSQHRPSGWCAFPVPPTQSSQRARTLRLPPHQSPCSGPRRACPEAWCARGPVRGTPATGHPGLSAPPVSAPPQGCRRRAGPSLTRIRLFCYIVTAQIGTTWD